MLISNAYHCSLFYTVASFDNSIIWGMFSSKIRKVTLWSFQVTPITSFTALVDFFFLEKEKKKKRGKFSIPSFLDFLMINLRYHTIIRVWAKTAFKQQRCFLFFVVALVTPDVSVWISTPPSLQMLLYIKVMLLCKINSYLLLKRKWLF